MVPPFRCFFLCACELCRACAYGVRVQFRVQLPQFEWSEWRPLATVESRGSFRSPSMTDVVTASGVVSTSGRGSSSAGLGMSSSDLSTSRLDISSVSEIVLLDTAKQPFTVLMERISRESGGVEVVFYVSTCLLNCTDTQLAYSQPVSRERPQLTFAAGLLAPVVEVTYENQR